MAYALDGIIGHVTGSAAPGTTLTMKRGSLTLQDKNGKAPYVVGLMIATTAMVRESYINFKVDSESSKTEAYRRFYPMILNDVPPVAEGLGFFPIMRQCKKGDVLDVRGVDVATTEVISVVILIHYGGPPRVRKISSNTPIYSFGITAATPVDLGTTYGDTGLDDIASGVLNFLPKKMDVIGGYCIPENASVGGVGFEQACDDGVIPNIGCGNGFLHLGGGDVVVLAEVDNDTAINAKGVAIAAGEVEAGFYAI